MSRVAHRNIILDIIEGSWQIGSEGFLAANWAPADRAPANYALENFCWGKLGSRNCFGGRLGPKKMLVANRDRQIGSMENVGAANSAPKVPNIVIG